MCVYTYTYSVCVVFLHVDMFRVDNLGLGILPGILFLSSHWLPVVLHPGVGPWEISSIHIGMSTGSIFM